MGYIAIDWAHRELLTAVLPSVDEAKAFDYLVKNQNVKISDLGIQKVSTSHMESE